MKLKKKNVRADRISDLPEFIIHQIMSHLSTSQVVQTSVLSKTWYRFQKNYPVLDFHLDRYGRSVEIFRCHVNKSLSHFSQAKISLEAVCFRLYLDELFPDLDSWISLALENGLRELGLYLELSFFLGTLYTLPQSTLSASKSLTILKLSECMLNQPLSVFNSLRKLGLLRCTINCPIILKQDDCPLLEDLYLADCVGFKSVHISNLLRLHTVEVKVDAHLEFVGVFIASQSVQNLTIRAHRLRPWSDIDIVGCDRLKSLHLQSAKITCEEFHSLLSKLPLLEELYLFNCDALERIKISGPQIKTLGVWFDYGVLGLESREIVTPSLKNLIVMPMELSWEIKVADCYHSLETLVLFSTEISEMGFHDLISKFPLLENLCIIGCHRLKLIRIPNLQLKRLHIVQCPKLQAVTVDSPNLCELSCKGSYRVVSSIAEHMYNTYGLKFGCETSLIWPLCLEKMLTRYVKDKSLVDKIIRGVPKYPECEFCHFLPLSKT